MKCSGHKGKYYSSEVNQTNSLEDLDASLKIPLKKTDSEAYEEYIKNFFLCSYLHLIASNGVAFPNAKPHAKQIHAFIRQHKFVKLECFFKEHDCLKNSITSCECIFPEMETYSFYPSSSAEASTMEPDLSNHPFSSDSSPE